MIAECTLLDVPRINATAACLLGLLQLGPAPGQPGFHDATDAMTGSQLWRAAAASIARFWNLTRSQVFRELPRLHAQGLVEPVEPQPRRQQPFRITAAGRAAFSAWLGDLIAAGARDEHLHSPLVLTVFFGEFLPRDALESVLLAHRRQHLDRLDALRAMQHSLGPSTRLPAQTLTRGVAYQQLTIDWIDSIVAAPDGPRDRPRLA